MPVSAIVTAHSRITATLTTLDRLKACNPKPAEILVHIDCGGDACLEAIRRVHQDLRIIASEEPAGPGGGRNKLIKAARNELVASFDDDSYPHDSDFFARVTHWAARFPEAAVYAATIIHRGETAPSASHGVYQQSDFIGCGCIYRRSTFLQTSGFVPLRIAYGIEEVDLALRMHALNKNILGVRDLRIFHDTNLEHHSKPDIISASVSNLILLAFLRYSYIAWPICIFQVIRRVLWLVRRGRISGLPRGILWAPIHCWQYKGYRSTVKVNDLLSFLLLRRRPVELNIT